MGPLIIVGASVRAAAMSARRSGYEPHAIDLFADRDLQIVARCQRIPRHDYPAGIGKFMRIMPPGPWMYTGGLENYPQLISDWSRDRELIGNGPEQLAKVRDPSWLSRHLPFATSVLEGDDTTSLEPDKWLVKPLIGAGGQDIHHWNGEALPKSSFLQLHLNGQSVSGLFDGHESGVTFIGSTIQLVGEPWLNAKPYQYCGSIGPRRLSHDERQQWVAIGQTLWAEGGLRGIFGVDAVLNKSQVTTIEVNPRYTASAELFELAQPGRLFAKGVYFAPSEFHFPATGPWDEILNKPWNPSAMPLFADIPSPGEVFRPGDPVITFIATAENEPQCRALLPRASVQLAQRFAIMP